MCGLDQETKRHYMVILWILIYHRVAVPQIMFFFINYFTLNRTEIPKI